MRFGGGLGWFGVFWGGLGCFHGPEINSSVDCRSAWSDTFHFSKAG